MKERFELGYRKTELRTDPYPRPLDEAAWVGDFWLPLHWAWIVALAEAIEREAYFDNLYFTRDSTTPPPRDSRIVAYVAQGPDGRSAVIDSVLVQRREIVGVSVERLQLFGQPPIEGDA